jgi:hypothetical protein
LAPTAQGVFPHGSSPTLPLRRRADADPHVQPQDERRLTGQNATILALLRMGSCTNIELSRVSLKYTGRISDLRAAGYRIVCHRGDGGVNTYTLQE